MSQNLKKVHWTKEALCKFDNKIFLSFNQDEVEEAKQICKDCPVQKECILAAADVDSHFVSAGTSKFDRLMMQWKRVSSLDESNFAGSERYLSEILRRIR